MSFFNNLGNELGTGIGKGTNTIFTSLWKTFCLFVSWLFSWKHKDGEHELHTNSFRLAIGSLILAGFFVPGLVTCSFNPQKTIDKYNPFQENKGAVAVVIQLDDGAEHTFPVASFFVEAGDNRTLNYSNVGDTHYIHYPKTVKGETAFIDVRTRLCALVPAGKIIFFKTKYRPVYVVNMKNEVFYTKKDEFLTIPEKIYTLIFKEKTYRTVTNWQYLNVNWFTVETDNHLIYAEALGQKVIVDNNAAGGLVCF